MLREDIQFMEIMESSITLQDKRYCLRLPFKNPDVNLPQWRSRERGRKYSEFSANFKVKPADCNNDEALLLL